MLTLQMFFLSKLAIKRPDYIKINDYVIKLVDNQYHFYGSINSLGLIELEILKIYIENNLANGFIRPSKFPTEALIFFDNKPDRSLQLYINY